VSATDSTSAAVAAGSTGARTATRSTGGADPGPTGGARPKRRRPSAGAVGAGVLLWGYAIAALVPLVLMLINSLRPERDLIDEPLGLSRPVADNYIRAWSEGGFDTYLINSLVVTVGAVALGAGVSVLAAYPLARHRFPGSGLLSAYFLSGLMLPIRLGIVPVFYLLDSMSLTDSRLGLTLVYAASGVPFSVFVLTAFFRQLPGELEEAARIDGAGDLRIFSHIMVPLVKPALATVMLFQFIPLWNDFFFPLVLVDTDNYTLPVGLTQFVTEFSTVRGPLYAGLVMATIPLVALFLLATKQIVAGLTAGMSR
jgi:raffinose/stachyose/melibiose transport system permease protein